MSDLKKLMKDVSEKWVFNETNYPGFDRLSPHQQKLFIIRHIRDHMDKAEGVIATQTEHADHGGYMDSIAFKMATAKILINTLQLALVLEMDSEELMERISRVLS